MEVRSRNLAQLCCAECGCGAGERWMRDAGAWRRVDCLWEIFCKLPPHRFLCGVHALCVLTGSQPHGCVDLPPTRRSGFASSRHVCATPLRLTPSLRTSYPVPPIGIAAIIGKLLGTGVLLQELFLEPGVIVCGFGHYRVGRMEYRRTHSSLGQFRQCHPAARQHLQWNLHDSSWEQFRAETPRSSHPRHSTG